ncbi:MAG: hypothetical protein P8Y44_06770 [Acidobacteriota bacterium]
MRLCTLSAFVRHFAATLLLTLQIDGGAASAGATEAGLVESEIWLGKASPKDAYVTVSADGRRLAVIVNRRGSMKQSFLRNLTFGNLKSNPGRILVDGELGPEYRDLAVPTFSPDGQRFVYLAMLPADQFQGVRPEGLPDEVGPFRVVIDGEAGPIYPIAVPPLGNEGFVFSPDGEEVVFQVLRDPDHSTLMVNRSEEATFDGPIFDVSYSPDGKHRALIADREGQRVVIVDGEVRGRYAGAGGLVFSQDGEHLAYVVRGALGWYAVVDGVEQTKFERVRKLVFSPDGSRVAYWAQKSESNLMVLDGSEIGRGEFLAYSFTRADFADALGPVFSPDGRRLAYVLKVEMNSTLVVGEQQQVLEKALPFHPTFSSDSRRLAYAVFKDRDEEVFAVVDGKEHAAGFHQANRIGLGMLLPIYRHVAPKFSPDSLHFAYLRTKKPKRWSKDGPNLQIVIDDVGSSYFDSIIEMAWQNPQTLWAVVQRGGEYLRLELRLP